MRICRGKSYVIAPATAPYYNTTGIIIFIEIGNVI